MRKYRMGVWAAMLAAMLLLMCGCSGGLPGIYALDGPAVMHHGVSPFEGGALVTTSDMLYCFNAKTEAFVPLCTRSDCSHDPYTYGIGECPAAELAYEGSNFVVHEDQLWFLTQGGDGTYIWKAEHNGTNPERIGLLTDLEYDPEIRRKNAAYGSYAVAYGGYLYTDEINDWKPGREDGKVVTRLVSIRLKDGRQTPLTEWKAHPEAHITPIGVYEEYLYYVEQLLGDGEVGGLYRIPLSGGTPELVIANCYGACMDQNWVGAMIYDKDKKTYTLYAHDLATGDQKAVAKAAPDLIANGRMIWQQYDSETQMYAARIYDLETGELQKGELCTDPMIIAAAVGDGFIVTNGGEYGYISEKDFLAGKSVTLQ